MFSLPFDRRSFCTNEFVEQIFREKYLPLFFAVIEFCKRKKSLFLTLSKHTRIIHNTLCRYMKMEKQINTYAFYILFKLVETFFIVFNSKNDKGINLYLVFYAFYTQNKRPYTNKNVFNILNEVVGFKLLFENSYLTA